LLRSLLQIEPPERRPLTARTQKLAATALLLAATLFLAAALFLGSLLGWLFACFLGALLFAGRFLLGWFLFGCFLCRARPGWGSARGRRLFSLFGCVFCRTLISSASAAFHSDGFLFLFFVVLFY